MAYAQQRSAAAKWLYERKDRASFWNPAVLTADNPDHESLKLNHQTALLIFTDLRKRELLEPRVVDNNGQKFPAYVLNMSKDKEWKEVMSPAGSLRRICIDLKPHITKIITGIAVAVGLWVAGKLLSPYLP